MHDAPDSEEQFATEAGATLFPDFNRPHYFFNRRRVKPGSHFLSVSSSL